MANLAAAGGCFVMSIVGVITPGIPTVPFVLATGYFLARSSPGLHQRFRNSRCGRRVNFKIGDRADWSYLLPKRLGKGRYVLDAIAVDKAGNRDTLARGRNRVVFFVR